MATVTFHLSEEESSEVSRKIKESGVPNKSEFMKLICEMVDPFEVQEFYITKVRNNAAKS